MPTSQQIQQFSESNTQFRKVLAGQISVQDFFNKDEFKESKRAFLDIYQQELGKRPEGSMFDDENVAAAWITKIRYNQQMTDDQFQKFINRSEEIFKGSFDDLKLKQYESEDNDLCAIMWGIEALNGVQSFDSGATRVRLPEGVAPKIVKALEDGGSVPRESTHAIGTKLIDKGLGKDIENEQLRAFTPRGMGAILVIPTSQNGQGGVAKASENKISSSIQSPDYDLLLKREDYGFNDTTIHSRVHSKIGFINYLTQLKEQYKVGMTNIYNKSDLAQKAEAEMGKGELTHRKEHLSELKEQSSTLINLLDAGKKEGLFDDFKTTWTIRIKWPPWEKKIVSSDPGSRKGLGDFLSQVQKAEQTNPQFAQNNQANLDKVRQLLSQASENQFGPFQQSREGNEVLVNCESGQAILVDNIAKSTKNSPVQRETLVPQGMVSEVNPEQTLAAQQKMQQEQEIAPETVPAQTNTDIKSSNIDPIIDDYKKKYCDQPPNYPVPKTENGKTRLLFPSPEEAANFLRDQASKERSFLVINEAGQVMAYSNGDGTLYKADGTAYSQNEKLVASDILASGFKIPLPLPKQGVESLNEPGEQPKPVSPSGTENTSPPPCFMPNTADTVTSPIIKLPESDSSSPTNQGNDNLSDENQSTLENSGPRK